MAAAELLLLALFSLLILLALLGNLLVTAAIIYDRSLRRSPENLFLVSLAISDLLVSVLVMVFAAANDLLGYWPFGQAYCQFWICFDITCSTASILNLCAISLDRYWHISRPMVYVRYCSRRRIYYGIVVVWFISALIGAAPLGFGFGSQVDNRRSLPQCEMRLPLAYAIASSLLSFFMPAAVMVLLYTKLYLYARRHVRSIKTQLHQATSFLIMQLASEKIREVTAASLNGTLTSPAAAAAAGHSSSTSSGASPPPLGLHQVARLAARPTPHSTYTSLRMSRWEKVSRHFPGGASRQAAAAATALAPSQTRQQPLSPAPPHRQTVNDQKARLTLGVIMGTFLLCWLPFFLVNILRPAAPSATPKILIIAVTWLGYANSAANPVIYSIFNRDFRRAFKKIILELFVCCERRKSVSEKTLNRGAGEERRRSTRSSDAPENNNSAGLGGGGCSGRGTPTVRGGSTPQNERVAIARMLTPHNNNDPSAQPLQEDASNG